VRQILRQLHLISAWLLVAGIVYQVFLAGAAIANLGGSGDFSNHIGFGYEVIGLLFLLVVVTAILARRGRRDIGITIGLLVLYVIQTLLPSFKTSMPSVAALHPVNAMLIFAIALWYARHVWMTREAAPMAAPAPAEAPAVAVDAS
jgi:hypothetical protein